jgi:hypothetical protein
MTSLVCFNKVRVKQHLLEGLFMSILAIGCQFLMRDSVEPCRLRIRHCSLEKFSAASLERGDDAVLIEIPGQIKWNGKEVKKQKVIGSSVKYLFKQTFAAIEMVRANDAHIPIVCLSKQTGMYRTLHKYLGGCDNNLSSSEVLFDTDHDGRLLLKRSGIFKTLSMAVYRKTAGEVTVKPADKAASVSDNYLHIVSGRCAVDGKESQLTSAEKEILGLLLEHNWCGSDYITSQRKAVRGNFDLSHPDGAYTEGRKVLKVLIHNLKKKIGDHTIELMWGVGYKYAGPQLTVIGNRQTSLDARGDNAAVSSLVAGMR